MTARPRGIKKKTAPIINNANADTPVLAAAANDVMLITLTRLKRTRSRRVRVRVKGKGISLSLINSNFTRDAVTIYNFEVNSDDLRLECIKNKEMYILVVIIISAFVTLFIYYAFEKVTYL